MQDGTGFPRLRVFIISFANLKDSIKMTDVRVRVTLMDSKGEIMEREVCVPPTKMCAKTAYILEIKLRFTCTSILADSVPKLLRRLCVE